MADIREGDRVTLRAPWVANHREQYAKMFGTTSVLPDDLRGTVRTVTVRVERVADRSFRRNGPRKPATRTLTTVLIDWDATPGRETWTSRYALSAVKHLKAVKVPAKAETWTETAVRDLRVGDVIEIPSNGAGETVVTFHQPVPDRDWFEYRVTGHDTRKVPGSTTVLKLEV